MSWRLQVTGKDTVYSVYLYENDEFNIVDGSGEEVGIGYAEPTNRVLWVSCDVPKPDIAGITELVLGAYVDQ